MKKMKNFEKKQMNAMKMDILADQMIATLFILKADLKIDVRGLNDDVADLLGTSAGFLAQAESLLSHPEMRFEKKEDKGEIALEPTEDEVTIE